MLWQNSSEINVCLLFGILNSYLPRISDNMVNGPAPNKFVLNTSNDSVTGQAVS